MDSIVNDMNDLQGEYAHLAIENWLTDGLFTWTAVNRPREAYRFLGRFMAAELRTQTKRPLVTGAPCPHGIK